MKFAWILFTLFLINFNVVASEWTMEVGDYSGFFTELDQSIGENYLFNCKILIEKIHVEDRSHYLISINDENRHHSTAIDISVSQNDVKREDISNQYTMFKGEVALNRGFRQTISLVKDFNGDWARFSYREFLIEPFTITNNIKCGI